MRALIGTYPAPTTEQGPGAPEGIWQANFDLESATFSDLTQITETESTSFLAHCDHCASVYAVSEGDQGALHRFAVTDHGLDLRQTVETFGQWPCHVMLASQHVITTNYGSGSVAAYRRDNGEGALVAGQVFQQAGAGPDAERQEGPHAHFAAQVPATQYVWVTDLGADRIICYQITAQGNGGRGLAARGTAVEFAPGMGPRHLAFDGAGYAFVAGELDNRVHVVQVDPDHGVGTVIGVIDLDGNEGSAHGHVEGAKFPSHIEITPSGQHLVTAIRGVDTLNVQRIDRDESGRPILNYAGSVPTGGAWPRHFKTLGKRSDGLEVIAVANQNSSTLDVLGFDPATGQGVALSRAEVPSPACIITLP